MDDTRKPKQPEPEAVRTTIVGARPPAKGKGIGNVPKGIEILLKKAAVDPVFRETLLARRAGAADEIGLRLEPAEVMMLNAIPAEHLAAAIASTGVTPSQLPAFLGKAAMVMLAALTITACDGCSPPTKGIQPDRPPGIGQPADQPVNNPAKPLPSRGIQPDRPAGVEKPAEQPRPPTVVTGISPDVPKTEQAPRSIIIVGATANKPKAAPDSGVSHGLSPARPDGEQEKQ